MMKKKIKLHWKRRKKEIITIFQSEYKRKLLPNPFSLVVVTVVEPGSLKKRNARMSTGGKIPRLNLSCGPCFKS
jgi:hypothetical protein